MQQDCQLDCAIVDNRQHRPVIEIECGHIPLEWKQNGNSWTTQSAEGTPARVYRHPAVHAGYVVEACFGGRTYARAGNYSAIVDASGSPSRIRARIVRELQDEAEGYVLRFETTGIQDPKGANDAIVAMNSLEWSLRLADWRAKNATDRMGVTVGEQRFVHRGFQIDANRINARGGEANMNRLEQWRANGIIEIVMSECAATEAAFGGPLQARKAMTYIQSQTVATTPPEVLMLRNIEAALFPRGADTVGKQHDVEIVFNAQKYGRILVTKDGGSKRQPGGILGRRLNWRSWESA